jgi:hypothetical protein
VSPGYPQQFWKTLRNWYRDETKEKHFITATSLLLHNLWSFARDSMPGRRRQRYGDVEYDWDHRVNTTEGTVSWRDRLLGLFLSPYQPTDPALFQEMMTSLPIEFDRFTFIDLGSGKGRTLLMASDYPFQKILGLEILPALHGAAKQNLAHYKSESQKCFNIYAVCADAVGFSFPAEPAVLYLFNPLAESGLKSVMAALATSLSTNPRAFYVLYHNPLLEHVLAESAGLAKIGGTPQYSIYASVRRSHTG